jgi:hypothetical protein
MTLAKKHNLSTFMLLRRRRRSQAGQSVLIALAVLFLLGFLGALFSIIVVRNLSNAQSQSDTLNTDYFAQAGINYANTELQTNPLGADWRPPLQFKIGAPGTVIPVPTATYMALSSPPGNDPDAQWLNLGYTRYNFNGGRFLIRIVYTPTVAAATSPTAKYLEIDSVGRLGTINPQDPTTYTSSPNNPPDPRRTELVAYKPIGIVDYSRFITNKDNRTDTANLGVPSVYEASASPSLPSVITPGVKDVIDGTVVSPTTAFIPTPLPIVTTYGSSSAYSGLTTAGTAAGGGSLRSNMNLRLYGLNNAYLNTLAGDDWEVDGNITFDNYDANTAGTAMGYDEEPAECQMNVVPNVAPNTLVTTPTAYTLYPSNDTVNGYNSIMGAVRDGSTTSDIAGYPRSIRRLNPPLIDTVDSATGLSRYEELTNETEVQTQQYSSSADYLPATVYIDNASDIQSESPNSVPATSLRDEWLNTSGENWTNGFYSPPGTIITLGAYSYSNTASGCPNVSNQYGITITRNDGNQFTAGGSPTTLIGNKLFLSYGTWIPTVVPTNPVGPDSTSTPPATPVNPTGIAVGWLDVAQPSRALIPTSPAEEPAHDVVIYASGNVRISGVAGLPDGTPVHVTIVTNGIAYIDGSVLKGNSSSSISILARQYVCVNTTQFLAGQPDFSLSNQPDTVTAGCFDFSNTESLTEHCLMPQPYGAGPKGDYQLYVTQAAGSITLSALGDYGIGPEGESAFSAPTALPAVLGATLVRDVEDLGATTATTPFTLNTPFDLSFQRDSSQPGDWLLYKAAILPSEVHIEAVMYAQDNSFFVIPGDWFNSDTDDSIAKLGNRIETSTADADFPFYGQPIDMQITVDGAISENVPADISDQADWMLKWGWIPRYHGSDISDSDPNGVSNHAGPTTAPLSAGVGLNIVYDYNAGFPSVPNASPPPGTVASYLRTDRFGRGLPFAPALPVSPDLLYSGQPPT